MHVTEKTESKSYKWVLLGLLWVTYFLLHGTRQIYNAALPQIKADFAGHGTDAQFGLVRTAFLFSYALMVPFMGLAADFFKRKWVIVIGTAMFSLSVFFTGYVDSLVMMFVMYGLLNGVGQCMIPGACSSLIAQYHVKTRSTALSIYQSALYVGIILCSVAAGWLGSLGSGGWRWAFWISGGMGVVWLVLLAVFLRDTPQQAANMARSLKWRHLKVACMALWERPTGILLTFAFGMLVFGSNCFRTWMPAYLQQSVAGITPAAAAFHSVFWFYVGSFFGISVGARVSDRMSERRPGVRLEVMFSGLALSAPAMAAMVYMPNLTLSCLMMFFFGIGGGLFDANLYAGLFDVIVPRFRAAAMGMYLAGAFLIGCPATAVLGWVGERFSLQAGMAIFGGTYALAALAVLIARVFFVKRDFIHGQHES